jgi:hypothetical protein
MSVLSHHQWAAIRQWLRIEPYDRDTNQAGDVRKRLEVVVPPDVETRLWLKALVTGCAHCQQPMHPIRQRESWGTWYLASACPSKTSIACSRSPEAAEVYRAIVADLKADPPASAQLDLFS